MKTRMNRLMTICVVAGLILAVNVVTQAQDFTWTYKSPMPNGKGSGAAAAVGETIYVIGGHTEPWTFPYGRICEAYNTATDTWTSKAILPHTNGRYALSAIAVNGKVYTFGGSNISGNYNTNNIDEYNPSTNTWIGYKATLPISIAKVALAEYNGKIYVFGGGFYTAHDWWADNVYEYDPVANTVTAKATMPTKRGYAYAGTVGDKIYVIGGFGGYDAHDELTLVEAYDPATNLWTTGYAPMPTGGAIEGVVINDRIYVNVRNTTSVYEYNPTSNNWTSKNPMQTARSEPCIAAVDNRLYVMGGWSAGHITTSVEEGVLESVAIEVQIDIKPGSCPNPLNVKDNGVLPIAVLGSEELDVSTIDVASIRLAGVDPVRSSYEDVSTPILDAEDQCECTTEGPDGYLDLTLKFNAQDIVAALGEVNDGDELQLTLTGALAEVFGGTPIEGQDCVVIIKKGKM